MSSSATSPSLLMKLSPTCEIRAAYNLFCAGKYTVFEVWDVKVDPVFSDQIVYCLD